MSSPLQLEDLPEVQRSPRPPLRIAGELRPSRVAALNRQITLAARPSGFPRLSDFQLTYALRPTVAAGEVLVRSVYLSLDPYMRRRMNDGDTEPMSIGEVMVGGAVGFVTASKDPGFQVGDAVEGFMGWQEYAVAQGRALRKLDAGAPISTALGVLGRPGLTAYFGVLDICAPRPGETFVVSGAAGSVGMVAGQIAKTRGCRVVGVAVSEAKISWLLDELGFDAALHYTTASDFLRQLSELCPAGIDAYFDTVGGATTDAIVQRINDRARIAICGQMSQDNLDAPETGPRWLNQLVARQAKLQGFLVSGFAARFSEARAQLAEWLRDGALNYREDIAVGIESAPQAFIAMLKGMNQGKQLVQLSEP